MASTSVKLRIIPSARRVNGFPELRATLTDKQNEIATGILKEINERLGFLNNVGLEYLTCRVRQEPCLAEKASEFGWHRRLDRG